MQRLLLLLALLLGIFPDNLQAFVRQPVPFQRARVVTAATPDKKKDDHDDSPKTREPTPNSHKYLSDLIVFPQYTLAETPEDCIELKPGQRLVCLGDVHGDFNALQSCLEVAQVYNSTTNQWTGKDTILVQCGDVLDRGSEELACFGLLAQLSHQAEETGGKVICLYGNHEALNAMGLFQYAVHDWEYEESIGMALDDFLKHPLWRMQYVNNQPARWATFEPGGLLANSLMANFKVAVKVGRTVCVHAGLTSEHLKDYGTIQEMNEQARNWIVNKSLANVTFNNDGQFPTNDQPWVEAEARQTSYINTAPAFLNGGVGTSSPIWMRDYSMPADQPPKNPEAQKMIDGALAMLDADRMVMGHTVQSEINCALDGKAWRVDVGVSRGVKAGVREVLEIVMTDNETEVVSVLTETGRIPADQRQMLAIAAML